MTQAQGGGWWAGTGLSGTHPQHVCEGTVACAEDLGRALETGQRLAELLMGE